MKEPSLQFQILEILRGGPQQADEINAALPPKHDNTWDALNDLLRQGRVRCRFGEWELVE